MHINGIDLEGLGEENPSLELPPVVQGRCVHIDADFLAYMMSAEKAEGDTKTFDDMKHNTEVFVTLIRNLSGATSIHLHLTPHTSNKGGRHEQSIQKEYQANRKDKVKPRYLHILRDWMAQRFPATLHQYAEADDGMASAQYAALAKGDKNLSIIASKDKDLCMVPGLHLDWDTGIITDVDNWGWTKLNYKGKIKGYGWKFFWAQMLMGDTADNTQGLPVVPGIVLNEIKPTQATTKAKQVLATAPSSSKEWERAKRELDSRKDGLCGPSIAQTILELIPNQHVAYHTIKGLYKRVGETRGFTHWKTGESVPWNKVFVSEAQLHWMRRNINDPLDVARWWQETVT